MLLLICKRFNYFVEGVIWATKVSEAPVNFWSKYVLDLYDIYLNDPSAVPEDLSPLVLIKNGEANITTNNEGQSKQLKGIAQSNVLCAL